MRKLRSLTLQDSSTHDSVSNDCSASHNVTQNAEHIVDTLPKTSAMSGKELCNPPNKRLEFTEEEDAFLVKGINTYGIGRWKRMRRDPELNFNPCRTSDTLIKRAIARHLIKRKARLLLGFTCITKQTGIKCKNVIIVVVVTETHLLFQFSRHLLEVLTFLPKLRSYGLL